MESLNSPQEKKIWKATLYTRTSKGIQDDKSNTLVNQLSIITEYAKAQDDIEVCSVRSDNGFSGLNFNRPAYQEMWDDIKSGNINCIIVKDLSRFSRSHLGASRMISRIFPMMGVRLIAVTDSYDSALAQPSAYDLLIPIKTLINQAYSMDTSKKITSHLKMMREKGCYMGAFPVYGYKRSEMDKHQLVPDEPAAAVVRQMFQWRLEGYSNDGIAAKLNAANVLIPAIYKQQAGLAFHSSFQKSEEGAGWCAGSVIRVLSNPIYTGTLEQGKTRKYPLMDDWKKVLPKEEWCVIENTHEALVTKECFSVVGRLLRTDTRNAPGKDLPYILSGIAKCADCGRNLIRKTTQGYYYYCCAAKIQDKEKCSSHRIRCDKLENLVQTELCQHIQNVKMLSTKARTGDHSIKIKQKVETLEKAIQFLEAKILRKRAVNNSLESAVIDRLISKEDLHLFRKHYLNDIANFQHAIERLEKQIQFLNSKELLQCSWADVFLKFEDMTKFNREDIVMMIEFVALNQDKSLRMQYVYQKEYQCLKRLLSEETCE